jgi:hypothetical protein
LTDRDDKPELKEEEMTRVIDTDAPELEEDEHWVDSESEEEEEWDELADEELPPRPRARLLRPLPIALIAVLIAASGFLAGVLVQKGSGESGGSGELPAFAAAAEAMGGAGGAGAPAALSAAGGSEAAATGTVTSVADGKIYVRESDGTVVTVKAEDGSTLTRELNVAAKQIHPGDTVVVEGSKRGSSVTASSIAATESGVESTGSGFPGAAEEGGGEAAGGAVESLFE